MIKEVFELLMQVHSGMHIACVGLMDGTKIERQIIDDLGERGTGFALEQMFEVIDSRCRSKKPMIITTNLTLHEMRNPPDLAYARIYDRILERCAPILFNGENFRKQKAEENKNMARAIVSA